jgi:hypothetical protein
MNIGLQRLYNQQVYHQQFKKPAEVVSWLGALQAQDYLAALWAVGLRLPHATEAEMEQAIADRTIIRTWPMRSTLHFVSPADVRWMLHLLTPRIIAGSAGRYRQLELDDRVFGRCAALFEKALAGGKQLSRPALYQVLAQAGISTAQSRGLYILSHLAQKGLICFGARQGRQAAFTLLEEWVAPGPFPTGEEALAALASRYFTSHGPATAHDFAWWSGLKVSEARLGAELAAGQLTKAVIQGQTFWFASDMREVPAGQAAVFLLPFFDEFTVAYKDRSAVIDPIFARQVNAGGGLLNPVMVADGQVVGTWKRVLKPKSVLIAFNPFRHLPTSQAEAFAAAADRYGSFLNLPATLSWPKVN